MFNRRQLLAGAGAAGIYSTAAFGEWAKAWAQSAPFKPEAGAKLNILRWKRFVAAEEDAFMALVANFTKATGVAVTVVNEGLDDVQPKASIAANTGTGPDLAWGLYSLPHLFPAKCVDVTDVNDYLGKKYGGWVPSAVKYVTNEKGRSLATMIAYNGNMMNYLKSNLAKAGHSKFPETTEAFLDYTKKAKDAGLAGGMALGRASGDGNAWVHWALWSHGGQLVDAKDHVIIDSPETVKALEYGKKLYENFIPGTLSWNDSSNNKAFLAGEISWTNNGVSIYAAAKAQSATDPKMKALAEDIDHASWPVGPVGKPTEFHSAYPMLIFKHSKVQHAAKAFITFMMEAENYGPWMQSAVGYLSHPLNFYDNNPVWSSDPKLTLVKTVGQRTLTAGGLGSVGEKAAAALADFIVLDMFGDVCSGRSSVKDAIALAERKAKRIYR